MEPSTGVTVPLWQRAVPEDTGGWATLGTPLHGETRCDVAVVGAGITGLTTAVLLARGGLDVVVLEARHIGAGTTGGSSAKVSLVQGTRFSGLARRHDVGVLTRYADATRAAQAQIAALCATTGTPIETADGVSYATTEPGRRALVDEAQAMVSAGVPARLTTDAGLPFATTGALRLPGQLQVDPQRYLEGLVSVAVDSGARVHTGTRVEAVSLGRPRELGCATAAGRATVRAQHVVVATGSPVLDRGGFFARLDHERSYCVAVQVDGPRPSGMYLSVDAPTRSLRRADRDLLVVGGNGHPVGRARDGPARIADLAGWATRHLGAVTTTHRWSAQDYRTPDHLPLVGRLDPWSKDLWVATGFAKWGMTTGTGAALALAGQILDSPVPWARDWDPWRTDVVSQLPGAVALNTGVVREVVRGWAEAVRQTRPDPSDVTEGHGVVGRDGIRPVAVSRIGGRVRAVSAICPHLGGILRWNAAERSWDCPLHGSRFAPDGSRLEGPARCGLARVDRPPRPDTNGPAAGP